MDLSPRVIDRKQDVASWPEGEIEQLTARDKNRYQKRKSAVIEYFQSDEPVSEISVRHHLSALDLLEVMALRCCMLHEDGRPWGFRALVPGARVGNAGVYTTSSEAELEFGKDEEMTPQGELFELEVQPEKLPAANGGVKTYLVEVAEQAELPKPASETEVATDEAASPVSLTAVETEQQQQQQLATAPENTAETAIEAEVEQEEFPALVIPVSLTAVETERQQQELPTAPDNMAEMAIEAEVEQKKIPAPVSEIQVPELESEEFGDEEELGGEPTGKLSALRPGTRSELAEDEEQESVDAELVQTSEQVSGQVSEMNVRAEVVTSAKVLEAGEAGRPTEEFEETDKGKRVDEVAEIAEVVEEDELDDQDTLEVARVIVEERLNR